MKSKIEKVSTLFFLILLSFAPLIFIKNFFREEKIFYSDFNDFASIISISEMKKSLKLQKPLVLMFVGDIMMDRGVEYMTEKYGKGDYKWIFEKVGDDLRRSDLLFGNLESVISDKGKKVGSINSFRANPKAIEGLTFAGFDIVSVANNHIFDYSKEAMEDSFQRLKEAGIDYAGGGFSQLEAHSPVIKEINETKFAFLAYNYLGSEYWIARLDKSGIAQLDEDIVSDIKKARETADTVIVSMHFGEEYKTRPSSEQQHFARLAIDSGADLIIGHHPHVIQPLEQYGQGYIVYSLGNFVFDQGFSEETMRGLLLKVVVKNRKISEVIPIDIKINSFFQPEIRN